MPLTICRILAVLCILYGIFIAAAGSGTAFFIVWFFIGTGFFFLPKLSWHRLPLTIKALAALMLTVFVFIECLIAGGFSYSAKDGLPYIVVPGAQVYESGPSRVLKYRLDRAVEYLNKNPETRCVVTGGRGYNEPFTEAEGMADYLYGEGIDPSRVILEKESRSTKENLQNAAALIGYDTGVGIVTNNFHVYRAVCIAKKLGFTEAVGMAARSTALFLPHNMLREFFSMLKFLLLG